MTGSSGPYVPRSDNDDSFAQYVDTDESAWPKKVKARTGSELKTRPPKSKSHTRTAVRKKKKPRQDSYTPVHKVKRGKSPAGGQDR